MVSGWNIQIKQINIMDRNSFENLLTDLYDIYAPAKKADIPKLLNNYNGMEFDAVYHILLKYNYPRSAHYNPKVGGEKQIRLLIESYTNGQRTAKEIINSNEKVNIDDQIKNLQSNVDKQVEEKLKEIDQKFSEINSSSQTEDSDSIEITIELLFDNSEFGIEIPKVLESSAPGTRIIILDKNDKIHGLEVKDVLEDFASYKGKHVRTIQIDKI